MIDTGGLRVDRMTYTIHRARLKVVTDLRDCAKRNGETDRYADLHREVREIERRLQQLLGAR